MKTMNTVYLAAFAGAGMALKLVVDGVCQDGYKLAAIREVEPLVPPPGQLPGGPPLSGYRTNLSAHTPTMQSFRGLLPHLVNTTATKYCAQDAPRGLVVFAGRCLGSGRVPRCLMLPIKLVGPRHLWVPPVAPRLGDPFLDDRRQAAFVDWRESVSLHLFANRGQASRLAEFLGVSRQRVSQWFIIHHRLVPGWVVMPTVEFFYRTANEPTRPPEWASVRDLQMSDTERLQLSLPLRGVSK